MATGFPTKANWAAGDVLTASAMDDLAGTVNLVSAPLYNAAGKNKILNADYSIWQRGTSFAATGGPIYTADRWGFYRSSSGVGVTVSRQSSGLTSYQYNARIQRDSGNTATTLCNFYYSMETSDAIKLAGQVLTLSFYARAGANYSSASNLLTAEVQYGTGTNQNIIYGYTGATDVANSTFALTTTWTRYTLTTTAVGASATELGLIFAFTPTGTAGTNDYFEITGVQLEAGTYATGFQTATGTTQGELAACQRYLPALNIGTKILGVATSTTQSYVYPTFPVTARTAPTGITIAALANYNLTSAGLVNGTPTAITFSTGSVDGAQVGVTTTAASPTIALGQGDWLTLISGTILFTGCEL